MMKKKKKKETYLVKRSEKRDKSFELQDKKKINLFCVNIPHKKEGKIKKT